MQTFLEPSCGRQQVAAQGARLGEPRIDGQRELHFGERGVEVAQLQATDGQPLVRVGAERHLLEIGAEVLGGLGILAALARRLPEDEASERVAAVLRQGGARHPRRLVEPAFLEGCIGAAQRVEDADHGLGIGTRQRIGAARAAAAHVAERRQLPQRVAIDGSGGL